MTNFERATKIILPKQHWEDILEHCKRKLAGNFLEGESRLQRACGLVAGTQEGDTLKVERTRPVMKNVRDQEPYKTYMDNVMKEHAIPSKTPLSQRGWITDPEELKECYDDCESKGLIVLGTYHTHCVAWEHDPVRDTPTKLDTVLAKNSNLFSFIISVVDITKPIIRAYYEGLHDKEVSIRFED